ncbi:DUF1330 domain-containing protein [Xanthobacter agilis]|uniref:Uncharacterized protein (DUF1330 family) n=1 Tax=Xanthobacter agilis TaxID=47492 RepID=A0ABU0LDI7_XANAG|nr:DUF1330 domain-containing protein [Xanthobacter agilis]MDQ0505212.1 uncharacterized protein (DUF1330 family) [Xanthobacter agilis]
MAKGYWFINVDVVDPVDFISYAHANVSFLAERKAKFLIAGGDFEHMEGIKRHRNALVEWPSYEVALDAYRSPEYQRIAAQRGECAITDVAVVEGYDGEQPSAAEPADSTPQFPRGYWMVRMDVTDPAGYEHYRAENVKALAQFGGWFLVRSGRSTVVEGKGRSQYIVIAFPDLASARACYHSFDYQQAFARRKLAAQGDLIILSGHAGRQPAL